MITPLGYFWIARRTEPGLQTFRLLYLCKKFALQGELRALISESPENEYTRWKKVIDSCLNIPNIPPKLKEMAASMAQINLQRTNLEWLKNPPFRYQP